MKVKRKILVTGGPTRAYLDRVRFLSNISTGSLAFEICQQLSSRGHKVFAVIGPTDLPFESLHLAKLFEVETTEEMQSAVNKVCRKFSPDAAVFSAAVLDFKPALFFQGKKSSAKSWKLKMTPTPKIIDEVTRSFPKISKIGFKLEWVKPPRRKMKIEGRALLTKKKLGGLVLNYLPEISAKTHPAYLFSSGAEGFRKVKTKKAIAVWVCQQVEQQSQAP